MCFVGEAAIDTGGPSRELWRLFGTGILESHCRSGPEGCFFDKNVPALQVSTLH